MLNPPLRSPRVQVAGLSHLGRLLNKIRLHLAGSLPEEYRPNLGLPRGLDGQLCGFLGVDFEELSKRVAEGGTDEEIAEWCFAHGLRPNPVQKRVWNEFARKFGWNDGASAYIERSKAEEGMSHRTDIVTAFDGIDLLEGRLPDTDKTA